MENILNRRHREENSNSKKNKKIKQKTMHYKFAISFSISSLKHCWNKNYLSFSKAQKQEIPQFLGGTVQILGTEMSGIEGLNDEIYTAVLRLNSLYL